MRDQPSPVSADFAITTITFFFEPVGPANEFTRYAGWQSQAALPELISQSYCLVFPTLAQEALGRSAVEAMACGRPVIASRIGGLPFVVQHGVTGLLVEPGDPAQLAAAMEQLLDNPALCQAMGAAARRRFEQEFDWDVIMARHYRPLLGPVERTPDHRTSGAAERQVTSASEEMIAPVGK